MIGKKSRNSSMMRESRRLSRGRTSDENNNLIDDLRRILEGGRCICGVCNREFEEKDNFKRHLLSHIEEPPFECYICNEKYPLSTNLALHLESHTGGISSECPTSSVEGSSPTDDSLIYSNEKRFVCSMCDGHIFATKECFKEHLLAHVKNPPFVCYICQKTFPLNSDLTDHFSSHFPENSPVQKNECKETFSRESSLAYSSNRQRPLPTDVKPCICRKCKIAFTLEDYLDWHKKDFSDAILLLYKSEIMCPQCTSELPQIPREKPFACTKCEKKYVRKGNLDRHIRLHANEDRDFTVDKKPFICAKCQIGFSRKCNWNRHRQLQHADDEIKPKVCVKNRKTSSTKKHMNDFPSSPISTRNKPFFCSKCRKYFSSKTTLKGHLKLHTGIKPFVCVKCNRSFSQKIQLIVHTRIHTGEKPFSCNVCKKRFAQKSNLDNHLLSHTEKKPFCEKCQKHFSSKGNLKTHLLLHTDKKPFACSRCQKTFAQKSHLNKHVSCNHK